MSHLSRLWTSASAFSLSLCVWCGFTSASASMSKGTLPNRLKMTGLGSGIAALGVWCTGSFSISERILGGVFKTVEKGGLLED